MPDPLRSLLKSKFSLGCLPERFSRIYPYISIQMALIDSGNDVCRKSGILQIVFFKPGTFDNEEIKVKALKPCVVQIKKSKGKVTDMQIADPQNQEKLKPGVDVIIL